MKNAVFPRSWFNSETNFIKANYLFGHSPNRKASTIVDEDGNWKFNDETSKISRLIVNTPQYSTQAFKDYLANLEGEVDFDKMKFVTGAWPLIFGPNAPAGKLVKAINVDVEGSIEGCFSRVASLEYLHLKQISYAVGNSLSNCPKLKTLIIDKFNWCNYGTFTPTAPLLETLIINSQLQLQSICNFSKCPKLTYESLVGIINKLPQATTALTLTLGSTNLAKLTDDDIKIATDKGWTLA